MEKKLTAFNGYSIHMDTIKDILYQKKIIKKNKNKKTNLLLLSTTKKDLSKKTNLYYLTSIYVVRVWLIHQPFTSPKLCRNLTS